MNKIDDLNILQVEVLTRLARNPEGITFGKLRPEEIESDLFSYHLTYLVKRGWVKKTERKYLISDEGKKLVAMADAKGNAMEGFKVAVALYVRQGDKFLMQKRGRAPFFGDVTNIAGKVLPGEKANVAASRKLVEEAGLTAEFETVGVFRKIRRDKDGKLMEDGFFVICVTDAVQGRLITTNEFGVNFWASKEEVRGFEKQNADSGAEDLEILDKVIAGEKGFVIEQDRVVESY